MGIATMSCLLCSSMIRSSKLTRLFSTGSLGSAAKLYLCGYDKHSIEQSGRRKFSVTRTAAISPVAGLAASLNGTMGKRKRIDSANAKAGSLASKEMSTTSIARFDSPLQTTKAQTDDEFEDELQSIFAEDGMTEEEENYEIEVKEASKRPPPVNSDYLPLPWSGRLGYACLNTYLRTANPPVFSSRTCRIASILEHRHPLKDPTLPPHPTKNRPDKDQPADPARGQAYVESLGLANARDIVKMLRWNDRYGIKFLRLSSEMFPFASHEIYGYTLAPFASEVLEEAGRVAAQLGHRLTTHPGQYTQLGSPREEVIRSSIRDLEYHREMLDLLKLPPQQDRDAVIILHMGGTFGDKAATLDRFRQNYSDLPQNIKNRIVLENDDMSWSVHDLLPICEELNIPFVLDFHHNNIIFDATQIREGTLDIMQAFDRIEATWKRKNITQKMHYSEQIPGAITSKERRRHNSRVSTLPPCSPNMDLMIEAKDKEQAVFELMRNFKLPGYDLFNDVIPHIRTDENRPLKPPMKKRTRKRKMNFVSLSQNEENEENEDEKTEVVVAEVPPPTIPDDEVGMGGPERRVYWPPGMEAWLKPPKRVVGKASDGAPKKTKVRTRRQKSDKAGHTSIAASSKSNELARKKPIRKGATPMELYPLVTSDYNDLTDEELVDLMDYDRPAGETKSAEATSRRRSTRAKKVNYAEDEVEDEFY